MLQQSSSISLILFHACHIGHLKKVQAGERLNNKKKKFVSKTFKWYIKKFVRTCSYIFLLVSNFLNWKLLKIWKIEQKWTRKQCIIFWIQEIIYNFICTVVLKYELVLRVRQTRNYIGDRGLRSFKNGKTILFNEFHH